MLGTVFFLSIVFFRISPPSAGQLSVIVCLYRHVVPGAITMTLPINMTVNANMDVRERNTTVPSLQRTTALFLGDRCDQASRYGNRSTLL